METYTKVNENGIRTTTLKIKQEELAALASIRPEFGIDFKPEGGAKANADKEGKPQEVDFIMPSISGTFYDLISPEYTKDDEKAYLEAKKEAKKAARSAGGDFTVEQESEDDEDAEVKSSGDPRYSYTFKTFHTILREKILSVIYQAIPKEARKDKAPEITPSDVNTFFGAEGKFSPLYRYIKVKKVGNDFIIHLPVDNFHFRKDGFDACAVTNTFHTEATLAAVPAAVSSLVQHGFAILSPAKEFSISKDKVGNTLTGRFHKANQFYAKYVVGFHAETNNDLSVPTLVDPQDADRVLKGNALLRNYVLSAVVKLPANEAAYYVQTPPEKITPSALLTFLSNWYQKGIRGRSGFPTYIHSLQTIVTKNAAYKPKPRIDKYGLALTRENTVLYIPGNVNLVSEFTKKMEEATLAEDGSATFSHAAMASFPQFQLIYVDWVNQRLIYSGEYSQMIVEDIEANHPLPISSFIASNEALFKDSVDSFYSVGNLSLKIDRVLGKNVKSNTDLLDLRTLDAITEMLTRINSPAFQRAFPRGIKNMGMTDYAKGLSSFLYFANADLSRFTAQELPDDDSESFLNCYPLKNRDLTSKPLLPFTPFQEWFNSIEEAITSDADWLQVINECKLSPYETMSQIAGFKIYSVFAKNAPAILREYSETYKPYITQDEDTTTFVPALKNAEGLAGLQPHQRKVAGVLAKHPKFAVIAVQAGGGKTILALQDILNCLEHGVVKKPLVMCPSHLVKDYVAEAIYVSWGKLNTIVFDTTIFRQNAMREDSVTGARYWDFSQLKALCDNAPINTVFVIGYDSMTTPKNVGVYGSVTDAFRPKLEFMRSVGFDGVWMDESHKLKGDNSLRVSIVESLVTDIPIKRLLTGTVVPNTLHDLVRQIALMAPNILGNQEQFEERFFMDREEEAGRGRGSKKDKRIPRPGAEREIRDFIKQNCAYINIQRKEWQASLPKLREHYVPIDLTDAQQEVYDIILGKEIAEMEARGNKVAVDEEDADAGKVNLDEIFEEDARADSDDSELERLMETTFKKNIARIEAFLSNPTKSTESKGRLFGVDALSPKGEATKVILRKHLKPKLWATEELKKNKSLLESGMYTSDDDIKVLKGRIAESEDILFRLNNPNSKEAKERPVFPGKILVFCNTHLSVEGIIDSISSEFGRDVVLPYEAANKTDHEREFKTNDKIRVLVGIRNSLEEGLNLQMADTLIRVDNVWTPGQMEQGMSRINRPNLKGTDFRKEIHIYSLVVDKTIDVLKTSKITSKAVTVARFYAAGTEDEAAYTNIGIDPETGKQITPIKISIANLKKGWTFGDLQPYWDAYQELRKADADVADRWRQAQPLAALQPVPVNHTGIIPGSKRLKRVPYIAGMSIYKSEDLGLVPYLTYKRMKLEEGKPLDPKNLALKVHTAYGDGIANKETKKNLSILLSNGVSITASPSTTFVITKKYTSTIELLDVIAEQTELEVLDVQLQHRQSLKVQEKESRAESKRKANSLQDRIRTLNENRQSRGVSTRRDSPVDVVREDGEEIFDNTADRSAKQVALRVARFNEMIGVVLPSDDPKADLEKFAQYGFSLSPQYSWVKVKNVTQLKAFLNGMTDLAAKRKVQWRKQDADMWESVYAEYKKNKTFTVSPSTFAAIKNFMVERRRVLDTDNVRPQPLVKDHQLYIVFDLKQHLKSTQAMKKVQTMATKLGMGTWELEKQDLVALVSNKADAKNVMKEVRRDGWVIKDEGQFSEDLDSLIAKGKKKSSTTPEVKKPKTTMQTKPSSKTGKAKPKVTLKSLKKKRGK